MNILMTSLTRAKNGDWFARKGIPADVRDSYQRAYGVRQEERFRSPAGISQSKAKIEFSEWLAEIEARIVRLRGSLAGEAEELTHRQIYALVGRWYDWFIGQHEDDPLTPEAWSNLYERYEEALGAFGGSGEMSDDGAECLENFDPRETALVQARVQELGQVHTFLALEAVTLTPASLSAFVMAVGDELGAVSTLLRRRAGGDYRPDQRREKFPQHSPLGSSQVKPSGWTAWEAFEAWVMERKPAASTVNRWRGVFEHLNTFLDGRDIATMTGDEAVRWKDELMAGSREGRTVNEVWLTAARRIFNWVKDQKRIRDNPFDGVRVAVARTGQRKTEFREEDAEAILRASLTLNSKRMAPYLKKAIRWVPWLCAYTGSRSGEMTQLRREDIEEHKDGFWMLHIRAAAGAVKGNVERTVVLHEHLIEQGFIEFVQTSKPGPLFYDAAIAKAQKTVDPLNPPRPLYVQTRQKLADWVRKLGVKDPGVGPNHGWRHTFKRRAARAKIEQRLRDAFCGHSAGHVGAIYELPTVEDLAEAIRDFPRYPVEAPKRSR